MIVDLAVSVGAFVAALAGVNLTARTVFAMAREGGMPRRFAWTHPRFGTPWAAIGAALALTLALVVVLGRIVWNDPFKYFGFMATTATFPILGAYILIAVAGMIFFWRSRSSDTAFNVVFDALLPLGAIAICGYTIYESFKSPGPAPNTWSPWIAVGWLGAGIVVLAWLMTTHPDRVRSFGSILGDGRGGATAAHTRGDAPAGSERTGCRSRTFLTLRPARPGPTRPPSTGPQLLERGEQLALIESVLARGREGSGGMLVIEGPAGIGKTAMLGAALAVADRRGMRLLRARGAQLEREFAFGVARQLLELPLATAGPTAASRTISRARPGVAAELLGLPGARSQRDAVALGPDPPFAVLHGLYWLCANLARAGAGVHRRRRRALGRLAVVAVPRRSCSPAGGAGVAVMRPRGHARSGADAGLLAALTTDPGGRGAALAPLTRAAIADFLEAGLGPQRPSRRSSTPAATRPEERRS